MKFRGKNRDAGETSQRTTSSSKSKKRRLCPESAKDIIIFTLALTVMALLYLEYIGAPWIEQKVNSNLVEDHVETIMKKFEANLNSRLEGMVNKIGANQQHLKQQLEEQLNNLGSTLLSPREQVEAEPAMQKAEPAKQKAEPAKQEPESAKQEQALPVKGCPADTTTTMNYRGYTYRTLTGLEKDVFPEPVGCESTPTSVPEGWELAPPDLDVLADVVRKHYWSTPQLYFADLKSPKHTLLFDQDHENIPVRLGKDGKLSINEEDCGRGLLIRKKCLSV